MSTRTRIVWPVLWCGTAAALFGASTPASKWLLDAHVAPSVLAGLLYLGAGLASLPFAIRGGSRARRRDPVNLRRLAGAVLFGGVAGPLALMAGLATASSANVSLWLQLETTATALFAWALFHEHLGVRGWLANGLVVVAGVLLAAPSSFAAGPSALLVLAACACWGIDNNLTAIIDGYTPVQTTAVKGFAAGATNLAIGLALGGAIPSVAHVGAALGVGALAYGASIVLYIRGAQQLGATRSQMIFATAPFLGVLASWGCLGEPVLPVQIAAGLLMGIALAALLSHHHAHEHAHPAIVHTHAHRHDDGHHDHEHDHIPPEAWHVHEHAHDAIVHTHPHVPDIHHRHRHGVRGDPV